LLNYQLRIRNYYQRQIKSGRSDLERVVIEADEEAAKQPTPASFLESRRPAPSEAEFSNVDQVHKWPLITFDIGSGGSYKQTETELAQDIRDELVAEDARQPPAAGKLLFWNGYT
jgi:hypothetical protein